jgi:hypothetical protein
LVEPLISKPECFLRYNGQANVIKLRDVICKTVFLDRFRNVD